MKDRKGQKLHRNTKTEEHIVLLADQTPLIWDTSRQLLIQAPVFLKALLLF